MPVGANQVHPNLLAVKNPGSLVHNISNSCRKTTWVKKRDSQEHLCCWLAWNVSRLSVLSKSSGGDTYICSAASHIKQHFRSPQRHRIWLKRAPTDLTASEETPNRV